MAKKRPVRPKQSKGNALDDYRIMVSNGGQHWEQFGSGNDVLRLHGAAVALYKACRWGRIRLVRRDGTIAWRIGEGEMSPTGVWLMGNWNERHGRHES